MTLFTVSSSFKFITRTVGIALLKAVQGVACSLARFSESTSYWSIVDLQCCVVPGT